MRAPALLALALAVASPGWAESPHRPVASDRCGAAFATLRLTLANHLTVHALDEAVVGAALQTLRRAVETSDTPWLATDVEAARALLAAERLPELLAEWRAGRCETLSQLGAVRTAAWQRALRLVPDARAARRLLDAPWPDEAVARALADGWPEDEAALRERLVLTLHRQARARDQGTSAADLHAFTAQRFVARSRRALAEDGEWPYAVFLHAVVGALDGHAAWRAPGEVAQRASVERAVRSGWGALVGEAGVGPLGVAVVGVVPGSVAVARGLKVGDVVVSVNGQPLAGLDARQAQARLDDAKRAVLEVGAGRRQVVLERSLGRGDLVGPGAARAREVDGVRVAVVAMPGLEEGSASLLRRDLEAGLTGARAGAVVLDLRGNGGGLLKEAAAAAGLFLAGGAVARLRGADGAEADLMVPGAAPLWTGPLVVLVDEGTASAAELLAGALKARGRALVAGASRTFGKGTVQVVLGAADGVPWGEVVVTRAEFRLPGGTAIQRAGVSPDVRVPGPVAGSAPREEDVARALELEARDAGPPRGPRDARTLERLQVVVDERSGRAGTLSAEAQLEVVMALAAEMTRSQALDGGGPGR